MQNQTSQENAASEAHVGYGGRGFFYEEEMVDQLVRRIRDQSIATPAPVDDVEMVHHGQTQTPFYAGEVEKLANRLEQHHINGSVPPPAAVVPTPELVLYNGDPQTLQPGRNVMTADGATHHLPSIPYFANIDVSESMVQGRAMAEFNRAVKVVVRHHKMIKMQNRFHRYL